MHVLWVATLVFVLACRTSHGDVLRPAPTPTSGLRDVLAICFCCGRIVTATGSAMTMAVAMAVNVAADSCPANIWLLLFVGTVVVVVVVVVVVAVVVVVVVVVSVDVQCSICGSCCVRDALLAAELLCLRGPSTTRQKRRSGRE